MFRILLAISMCVPVAAVADSLEVKGGSVEVTQVIRGLDTPWSMSFLPNGGVLVTERDGELLLFENGKRTKLRGVPKVWAEGQGGLLDVVVAKDFAKTREIFLTYSEPRKGGAGTALASAVLSSDKRALSKLRVLFRQSKASNGGRHFGSRVVEGRDGALYVTVGDRGVRDLAQDMSVYNGKTVRVARDGSSVSIWSSGHRNAQGAAVDGSGRLWTVEHGARGGDEINQPQQGKNYGWPVISYGQHYSGGKIGEGTSKAGMEQPKLYWDPSIAPSGMMIYSGKLFPAWKGDIFVGSLKFDMMSRSEVSGRKVDEAERLFKDQFDRIRDIREAPDGSIWFMSVGEGAIYRMTPS